MALATGLLALNAGMGALRAYNAIFAPSFKNTAYGKYLTKTSKKGALSPSYQAAVKGAVIGEAGNVAQKRTAGIRGYLESTGMKDSIAGARALDAPGRDLQKTVTSTQHGLTAANEQSKIEAEKELAVQSNNYGAAQRGEKLEQALHGVTQGVMTGYQTAQDIQYREDMGQYYKSLGKAHLLNAGGGMPTKEFFAKMSQDEITRWVYSQKDWETADLYLRQIGVIQ